MIVYHGSNHNFKTLKIAPRLCEHESTKTNEGYGIYFSTDRTVAESYGKYVYVLEINDECFVDYRKKTTCMALLNRMRATIKKKTGLDICQYINLQQTATYMYFGGLAITHVGKEIYDCLDSTSSWYEDTTQTQQEQVRRILNTFDKKYHKAFMFNYHIKNIGVIKNVDESVVKIIRKEPAYLQEQEIQVQALTR